MSKCHVFKHVSTMVWLTAVNCVFSRFFRYLVLAALSQGRLFFCPQLPCGTAAHVLEGRGRNATRGQLLLVKVKNRLDTRMPLPMTARPATHSSPAQAPGVSHADLADDDAGLSAKWTAVQPLFGA